MIALANQNNELIKMLSFSSMDGSEIFGFHKTFGFISEKLLAQRNARRKSHGLHSKKEAWLCQFKVVANAQGWNVQGLNGCQIEKSAGKNYTLKAPNGTFQLVDSGEFSMARAIPHLENNDGNVWKISLAVAILLALMISFIPATKVAVEPEQILEPITVKITETQKAVRVPVTASLMDVPPQLQKQAKEVRQAVQQNLGFLGFLGKKDLKKALGGMPTKLSEASAGAGAGGMQGSGGELLVGLGQGVKRTTVGNTGVAGLGGIGTKGVGGGAGGYGNALVGSGNGRTLSAIPVSQDIVLEGGLDRAVIQATIAKYLAQVRACYEEQLQKNPGLMGQVSMNFEINGGGALNYARVGKSTLGNQIVEGCISAKMMNWQFPKPLGGVNVKVSYPFLLRPSAG